MTSKKKHKASCKKYKPCILKYKALILKYMPYIFREKRHLIFNNLQSLIFEASKPLCKRCLRIKKAIPAPKSHRDGNLRVKLNCYVLVVMSFSPKPFGHVLRLTAVMACAIESLVGSRLIEWSVLGNIRSYLHEIECLAVEILREIRFARIPRR